MNENDGLLDFLTDGLVGRERDAVTRAFYQYAAGDPNSHPVGISVLLTACMRKLAQVPEKLQSAATTYQKVVADARELEKGLIERARSNAGVVAEFKDETRHAQEAWRETFRYAKATAEGAEEVRKALKPVLTEIRTLANDLTLLRQDLKIHDESYRQMVECANTIEVSVQDIQQTVMHSTKENRANWITIGLLAGIFLSALFSQLPWWGALLAFAGTIGLLQWLSRQSWNFVYRWLKKGETVLTAQGFRR